MLLRVRVTLPDRPGALGQVARTLGVAGADIVQVVVLERLGGRAVDDFTVRVARRGPGRPAAGRPGRDARRAGGRMWRAIGAPVTGGHDAELFAQVAANPAKGWPRWWTRCPGCSPRTGRRPSGAGRLAAAHRYGCRTGAGERGRPDRGLHQLAGA